MNYVYLLRSLKDNNLYCGSTTDLKRRLKEHNNGRVSSTKTRIPFELIYYEAYKVVGDARNREKQLKYRGQALSHLKRRLSESLNS